MLELGASAPELHRECGKHAAVLTKIDWIFGVQGNGAELVRAAIEGGHPKEKARFFENSAEAAKFISGFIERGDLLLLKGSRGVRMEKILEAIEAGHSRAASKLTRERVEAGQKVKG
jgi:UDP-N-acetylmuramoyl-tripeptide--D-alanyl-D-alanine ligase